MSSLLIPLFWLLFAIFSAILASGKNRSTGLWFLVGLLVGPFGLLVAALPARSDPQVNRPCPHCAEQIKRAAAVCRHCGRDVEPVPAPIAVSSGRIDGKTVAIVLAILLFLAVLGSLSNP